MACFLNFQKLSLCLILSFVATEQATNKNYQRTLTKQQSIGNALSATSRIFLRTLTKQQSKGNALSGTNCFALFKRFKQQSIENVPQLVPASSFYSNEFGCNCINGGYQTVTTSMPIWVEKPNGRIFIHSTPPIYQSKHKVPIGTLSTIGEVSRNENQEDNGNIKDENKDENVYTIPDQFKDALREIFVKTLETHTLNDVDPFIRFITDYNSEMARNKTLNESLPQNMESFLDTYNVPFYSEENPAGIVIDLFQLMRKRNYTSSLIGSVKPFYLVTGYALTESFKPSYEHLTNLTKSRFQDHVAGVIQIYYGHRVGYILVEPGYYNKIVLSPFAVVLMEDQNSPHGEFIFGRKSNDITFTMIGTPKDMYVSAIHNKDIKQVGNHNHMVYYIGRSYCSFLETTTKGNLLRSEHGILTFDSNGAPVGHLSFNTKEDSFYLGKEEYDETSYVTLMHLIRLDDIQNDTMNKTQKDALVTCSSLLYSKPDEIISKMKNLRTELFQDTGVKYYEERKQELADLSNKYDLEKFNRTDDLRMVHFF